MVNSAIEARLHAGSVMPGATTLYINTVLYDRRTRVYKPPVDCALAGALCNGAYPAQVSVPGLFSTIGLLGYVVFPRVDSILIPKGTRIYIKGYSHNGN